jgi:hypothetical protein
MGASAAAAAYAGAWLGALELGLLSGACGWAALRGRDPEDPDNRHRSFRLTGFRTDVADLPRERSDEEAPPGQ